MAVPSRWSFPIDPPLVGAHSGAHDGGAPVNSRHAVMRALTKGTPYVEYDVWDIDGRRLLLGHDREQAEGGDPLEDVLRLVAPSRALQVVDLKGTGEQQAAAAARLGRAIKGAGLEERTLVSSLEDEGILALKSAHPEIATGLSFATDVEPKGRITPERMLERLARAGADAAMLDQRHANVRELADAARAAARPGGGRLGVFGWTARSPEQFDRILNEIRPDGIMDDRWVAHRARGLHPGVGIGEVGTSQPSSGTRRTPPSKPS